MSTVQNLYQYYYYYLIDDVLEMCDPAGAIIA